MPDTTGGLCTRRWIASTLVVVFAFYWADPAVAAELVVKGQELKGSVVGVTAKGVEFHTIYGKGTIVVPWSDVERLRSDKEFEVLYGDDEITKGRIWGLDDGNLLVGESPDTAVRIPVNQIYRSLMREDYEKSYLEVLRARYRYWKANFDIGFAYTDATTDTSLFSSGLELRRKKTPTEFFFRAFYLFGTTKKSGERRITNENRILGRTRFDYNLTDRLFLFGIAGAEYDEIQRLSLRFDPVVGPGYRFVNREKLKIAGRTGPGYIYQRYFGGDTESYFTILFGGDLEANLPYDSTLRVTAEYLPAVTEWTDNYIFRGVADWTMPIIGWLDFKLTILETYNSRPAEGAQRNSFTSTAGLSFRF